LKLQQDKNYIAQELANTRQKLDVVLRREDELSDSKKVRKKISTMEEELESKNDEIAKMKHDMEILGQKLLDEMEKRDELQQAKDSTQAELEELTQSLFEEANTMVAKEARERHFTQEKLNSLEKQLNETMIHLQIEQKTLGQLRHKYAKLEQEHEDLVLQSQKNDSPRITVETKSPDMPKFEDVIDPFLFAHFKELVEQAPTLKATKLHMMLFMRNALEDDVTPCLRFGGNPRTSTKKFIDAIIANNCFIEEMDEKQINELIERDKRASQLSLEKAQQTAAPTPTVSLFNKTVLERITNAWTPSGAPDVSTGCSTCGRDEPYKYRFKISDVQQDIWYPICLNCRARLLAVCDFYQFIRNLKQGLYTTRSMEDLYLEALSIKRMMFYTRIGAGNSGNPDILFTNLTPLLPNESASPGVSIVPTPAIATPKPL
jgi:hypothetical protein